MISFSEFKKLAAMAGLSSAAASTSPDPADVGFDIIILAGQSNMAGRGTYDAKVDIGHDRLFQFGQFNGDATYYRKIFSGADPLHMTEAVETGLIGPAVSMARTYLGANKANRLVMLVPCAVGSTSLVAASHEWQAGAPGSSLYENAIAQANLAVAAAVAMYPTSRVVGVAWHQGEGDSGTSQAAYVTALKAVIAGFRSRITGASASWFIIGGMVPENITGTMIPINAAHIQVPGEVDKCIFVAGPSGYANGVHYTAPGYRILGPRMGLAIETAKTASAADITPPDRSAVAVADAAPSTVVITMTEPMNAANQPPASAFTVSGHVVSSAVVAGSSITLTLSAPFVYGESARVLAYTQPGGANNARDVAGNLLASFSGQAITNNVAPPATGITMTGPSGGVVSVASSNFTVGVTPVGGKITGTVIVTPSDGGAGGTFTSTSVGLTNGSPTATFTYTPASTGAKTISSTNNGALANPVNLTYTATAAATVPGAPTIGVATAGDTTISAAFTAPASDGGSAITSYSASAYKVSDDSLITATSGPSSPIVVTGLTNGIAAYIKVAAINAVGTGAQSAASNSATPVAPASYATFNPADKNASVVLTNGNLTAAGPGSPIGWLSVRGTGAKTSGKWYCEYKVEAAAALLMGVGKATASLSNFVGNGADSWGYYVTGNIYNAATPTAVATLAINDIVGIALDLDGGTLRFYKNNVLVKTFSTGITGSIMPMITVDGGAPPGKTTANFGASAFVYTPPAGHVAWTA